MATDEVMLQLGWYQFSVGTAAYQTLSRRTSWRWPAHNRIGADPALQFTGRDADVITLDGTIYPQFRGGSNQLNSMREMGDEGRPLLLVDGLGNIHGRWVIVSVREDQPRHRESGVPRRQDFSIEIKRYGDDSPL